MSLYELKKGLQPMMECMKEESLFRIKRALNFDTLTLYDGVKLVKNSNNSRNSSDVYEERKSRNKGWIARVLDDVSDSLEDHVLQVDLKNLVETARGRHSHTKANKMMPIMMFGITLMGMVLVPMGFQFLAVLGGKALLLSKMALLLSSLQGLKKVASTSYAHGLYGSSPPYYDWGPYERTSDYYHQAIHDAQKRY
ncbi:uncharacterized protein LOC113386595 [Ctenocephalides felis]|uniref:uncharacterized protein LOC113386595 n=1 Tax=Ctenocephalides felis TaxID=7515 RepID=UPI000E6E5700|nr:uncharacterized protein LOC113386595 [Ctenocephalides felis]